VKMISINSDYNRKTHEIENKFKDHWFDWKRMSNSEINYYV
jgi:hypothetical protein